ncbi:MAG: hypothetical protein R3272_15075, partial [Candidatus Promineifilaceae bacterium]|nr:hypothetical protein [Candidatus Promineifilaceae bacterium]
MPEKKSTLTLVLPLLLLLLSLGGRAAAHCGDGAEPCPASPLSFTASLEASGADSAAAVAASETSIQGAAHPIVQEGVTVRPARTLPGMDDAPAPAGARYVDPQNPEWTATFGTEAGRRLIEPRPAPGPAPAGPPLELDGTWRSRAASGSAAVVAMANAPDGRLFAAVADDGLRVYAPDANGVYSWAAIKAGDRGGLASNDVTALAIFEGELWVGTGAAGVSLLDLQSGAWRTLHAGNSGLPNDTVNSLTAVQPPSGAPYIWIGTQTG